MYAQQPIDRVPRHETDLRGAWLGKGVAHTNLGVDFSAAGDDLTPVNPLDITARRVGADFGGTNGYLRRAEADWRSEDSAGTVLAWVKRDAIGADHTIFCSADEGTTVRYLNFLVHSTNLIQVGQRDADVADNVRGSTTINADEWYRVAFVSNGSAYSLYVNGEPETLSVIGGGNNGDWLADTTLRDSVVIGSLRRNVAASFFSGQIKDIQYLSRALSAAEIAFDYQLGVPDDDLVLWSWNGQTDLTRFARTPTHTGGVIVGHDMFFDGTDDLIDWGDLGNIQAVSLWLDPETTTEEILLVDAGNDIMVNAGTVTYTGLTPVATYVDGVAGTTLVADQWQHLVCVFAQIDANNFEVGTDGANFGNILVRDLRVWDKVPSAAEVAQLYARTQRAY